MVEISDLSQEDKVIIKMFLQKHIDFTHSIKGKSVMDNFDSVSNQFKKVMPTDYRNALTARKLSITDVMHDKNKVYTDIQIDLNK
jgi:glutamate synthase domain-containing protein 3